MSSGLIAALLSERCTVAVFVDSSVWIAFFNGEELAEVEWLHRALGRQRVACGDIVVTEVLQGFRHHRDFVLARCALQSLSPKPMLGVDRALRAAEHYRTLRRRGITVRKTVDTLIATYCIDEGLTLLHRDRDFDPFEEHLGLSVLRTGLD